VDIVNATGDPAVANGVAAALRAAGLTVGTVSVGAATASSVEYPAAAQAAAKWLAGGLGASLQGSAVPRVTLVLAAADSAGLVTAAGALPGC
jgi:hypothetical protein